MSVSPVSRKKLIALRIPAALHEEVEAIAQKEKAEINRTSGSIEVSSTLLMLLRMGIEAYKDQFGDY